MTGLEKWAKNAQTTVPEIVTLTMTENPEGWKKILGDSLDTDTPVRTGRVAALTAMLDRGRKGQISAGLPTISEALGVSGYWVSIEALEAAVSAPKYKDQIWQKASPIPDIKNIMVRGSVLSALIEDVCGLHAPMAPKKQPEQSDAAEPDTAAAPVDTTPDAKTGKQTASKSTSRRKSHYSANSQMIVDMLRPNGEQLPVREARAFLLSLPEYKPQDVALMSDGDVAEVLGKSYKVVRMGAGVVILPADNYKKLVDLLGSGDNFYIPSANQAQPASAA